MKKVLNMLLMVFLLADSTALRAQQTQPYTQYLFDRYLLNAAACGSNGITSISLVVKDQWSGFKGAPSNQMLSVQMRMPQRSSTGKDGKGSKGGFSIDNVGMGLTLFNDIRGPIRTTGGHLAYAYHLDNMGAGQLSFGLSINLSQLFLDRNKMTTAEEDIFLNASKLNSFVPDANFGLQYASDTYYAGASVMNVFQSFLMLGGRNSSAYRIERQYNVMGGYIVTFDRHWSLVSTVMVKGNDRLAVQGDFNTMFYFNDELWGGLSYRTGGGGVPGSASIMFGARYRQYHFGYAFDYSFGQMSKYSYESHELMFSLAFGLNERFFRFAKRIGFQNGINKGRTLF